MSTACSKLSIDSRSFPFRTTLISLRNISLCPDQRVIAIYVFHIVLSEVQVSDKTQRLPVLGPMDTE